MKLLLVYYHFEVCGGRYYLDAFKRLGHDVRHIGTQTSVKDAWGLEKPVPEKYAHKPDSSANSTDDSLSIQHWEDWTPDLILICDSVFAGFGYRHAHYEDVPHAVIAIDNHARDYEQPHYVHYFMAHYHGPEMPVDPARKDMTWLPCAYDPVHFTPSPIPWHEREYDLCMVGVMYDRRIQVIQALRDAGLKVFAETGLLYDEYRDAYHNSRISLCVSAAGDVAQRIFETGAMGCAILTDPLLDLNNAETNRKLGLQGFMVYTNPAEAVICAKDLLGTKTDYFVVDKPIETGLVAGMVSAASMAKACAPHTWDERAQVIVDWYEWNILAKQRGDGIVVDIEPLTTEQVQRLRKMDDALQFIKENEPELLSEEQRKDFGLVTQPESQPWLNLGCGRTHLPSERPAHHILVPEDIYTGREWVNVDRSERVGADCVFDLFMYPWPLESDSYDGALLSHLCEHIPHEINTLDRSVAWDKDNPHIGTSVSEYEWMRERITELRNLQDGWFAFFAELYRVLTNGAEVHIMSPFARSDGAISDPTHTRYLIPETFQHSMTTNPDAPFEYATGGIHFTFEHCAPSAVNPDYAHIVPLPTDPLDVRQAKLTQLEHLVRTQYNVISEFYVRLKVVK